MYCIVMKSTALLVLVLLYCSLITTTKGQCPVSGCSPNRCYCSEESVDGPPNEPKLHWHHKSSVKLSTKGCVANGDLAVCPFEGEEEKEWKDHDEKRESKGCIAVSVKHGLYTWECSSLQGGMPLPLVDVTGQVIASDGHYLMSYSSKGIPRGKPIYLFPEEGGLFDLVITDNNYFIMIYKCGFIAATDTNGIPWASVFLNDTYNSMKGTFVPLATPAVVGHRMYLPTAFWPHNSSAHSDTTFYLRLYAIDILDVQVDRIRVAWYITKVITGYMPTLEGNYDACKLTPPPPFHSSFKKGSASPFNLGEKPVGHVTALNESLIYYGLNFNNVRGGYNRFLTIGLIDEGVRCKEWFYDSASDSLLVSVSSLSYIESLKKKRPRIRQVHAPLVENYYLAANLDSSGHTIINVNNISDDTYVNRFNLEEVIMSLNNVQMTSDFMTMEYSLPAGHSSEGLPPFPLMYVIFGITGSATSKGEFENYLVGLSIDSNGKPSLLWKLSTPDKCAPLGLLPTLTNTGYDPRSSARGTREEEEEVILIVGTECGVSAYIL